MLNVNSTTNVAALGAIQQASPFHPLPIMPTLNKPTKNEPSLLTTVLPLFSGRDSQWTSRWCFAHSRDGLAGRQNWAQVLWSCAALLTAAGFSKQGNITLIYWDWRIICIHTWVDCRHNASLSIFRSGLGRRCFECVFTFVISCSKVRFSHNPVLEKAF